MPVIAILKSSSRYPAAFRAVGWQAVVAPPLVVEATGEGPLAAALAAPDRWSGLVLTSPRAVATLAAGRLPSEWTGRRAWAVGPETARRARALGLDVRGEEAGDAAALAERIAAAREPGEGGHAPFLFLCGDRRRDALPERLRAAGVAFEERVVYRSRLRAGPLLPPGLQPDWAAFFSPSGVRAAREDAAFPWAGLRVAALGPATATALRTMGLEPAAVAERPRPEALLAAVLHASLPTPGRPPPALAPP